LLRAFYYTAVIEDQEYSSVPLTDWLSYNGYTVVTKAVKEFTDAGGRRPATEISAPLSRQFSVAASALR
jgi:uncharacterized LabA/DUF88 family protein